MITINIIVILFVFRISLTSDKSLLYKKQNIFEIHFTRLLYRHLFGMYHLFHVSNALSDPQDHDTCDKYLVKE